jgi:four helix bundle protein
MDDIALKKRTKQLALRVMKMVETLPNSISGQVIGKQIVRSATSVGANYRVACRGRSKAEFLSKLQNVIEEADETCYWLELIIEGDLIPKARVENLLDESNQITAIMIASRKTASDNHE